MRLRNAQGCLALLFTCVFIVLAHGCGAGTDSSTAASNPKKACTTLTGTSWVPSVSGVVASNHLDSPAVSASYTTTGLVTGLGQAATAARELTVTFPMTTDLGAFGSIMLIGQVEGYPAKLQGSAYAQLVSLSDGVNEFVNLARSGSAGDCAASGYYICVSGSCSVNNNCKIKFPSAYRNRDQWDMRQGVVSSTATNYPSVNVFPTCNWSGGPDQTSANPNCAFYDTLFPSGTSRLRFGANVTYTAKYILLADSYSSVSDTNTATLKVTVLKKTNTRSTVGGAFDINVILVGNKNVQASRTSTGKRNLNTLMNAIVSYFGQSSVGLKIGTIRPIEWGCDAGGDDYAITPVSEIGDLLTLSAAHVPSSSELTALNLFLVSSIESDSSSSNLTILGIDGAIPGPLMNGTGASGMAVSTFDVLDTMNASCPTNSAFCTLSQQDNTQFQLGDTVTHEMGHYFGLDHLAQSDGTGADSIADTPLCTKTATIGGSTYITISSCRQDTNVFAPTNQTCAQACPTYSAAGGTFCSSALACQFNYTMWWTGKNFHEGTGASDGVLFSAQEGQVINYHPLVY